MFFGAIILAVLCAYSLNATLIYDDLWIITLFRGSHGWQPDLATLGDLFSTADLNGEYRTYGLSKLIHLGLFYILDTRAWAWGLVMGITQLATAWMLYRYLSNFRVDRIQSSMIAATWLVSPFSFTSCFHHYSYLILPCQLTISAALVHQMQLGSETGKHSSVQRMALITIGMAIAWTGEAHFILTGLVIVATGFLSPSLKSWQSRAVETMIPLAAISAAVLAHRVLWAHLILKRPNVAPRFNFTTLNWEQFVFRGKAFLLSIPEGIMCQIKPIITFAGWPTYTIGFLAAITLAYLFRVWLLKFNHNYSEPACVAPRAHVVPFVIFLCLIASIAVTASVAILSDLIMDVLPRRYGFIPFTIGLMLIIAITTEPRMRRKHGFTPMATAFCIIVILWGLLHVVCLPTIRKQDRRLWNKIREAAAKKHKPSLVFINARDHPDESHYLLGAATPAMRDGLRFPEIFESPFASYWMAEPYACLHLGIPYAGFRAVPVSQGLIQLNRQDFFPYRPKEIAEIPTSSLIVVADTGITPPHGWRDGLKNVAVIPNWRVFQNTLAAHGGSIRQGWAAQFPPETNLLATIDLGMPPDQTTSIGILPDKRIEEPWESGNSITNYGLKAGDDNIYKMSNPSNQLSYYSTNRNGNFTYEIEFANDSRKIVYLDFMELWHSEPKMRQMILEVNYGRSWTHVAVLDPYTIAGNDPFSVRLAVASKSVQFRISPAPHAADIPFINGIRIFSSGP